ncbi:MAG: M23 family metallopeptidase [Bacilli bacterium]
MNINEIRKRIKKKETKQFIIPKFANRILFTLLLFIITLVTLKSNTDYKQLFYDKIYNDNISFASINKFYHQYFGSPLPFNDFFKKNAQTVFNEKLKYNSKNIYLNGVNLSIDANYLVPSIENGIVIFVGEKEGYGNTIIIEGENDVDIWYGNLSQINVKMYDYIKSGSLLGEASNNLYLVFMKDGKIMNYENHI